MKIGKYIIEIVPYSSVNHDLSLPYNNFIWWETPYNKPWTSLNSKPCKHLKPNTGIRYKIIGK